MNLFGTVKIAPQSFDYPYTQNRESDDHLLTFQSFIDSLQILLQCVTGQNWDYFMMEYAEIKPSCRTNQTYQEIISQGVNGCGTWLSYPYFLSLVILLRLVMTNLFLAIVIEGYLETLKESDALINPFQMEEIIEKWSEYDPQGTGFISPEDLAFLLYELPAPLGFKDDNTHIIKNYEYQSKLDPPPRPLNAGAASRSR